MEVTLYYLSWRFELWRSHCTTFRGGSNYRGHTVLPFAEVRIIEVTLYYLSRRFEL